ncbi:MAG TPA: penicillin-binding protein 1C, partial [Beijerinckiaceae bacterium]|nr:penicillin-binding protein 1C [Beijerinckiaceae bacterium]
VPGLTGRSVAAPVLFDAFARMGGEPEPLSMPRGVLMASNGSLPMPLRHLRKDLPKTASAALSPLLRIAYPPDGARIDLGLGGGPERTDLALKAQGGRPPLIWLVNGQPVVQDELRRQAHWNPDGAGFARVTVMDAAGATDSVTVRLE